MNAQQRFRLRRKLTAALLQTVTVVSKMQSKGVTVNRENVVAAGTLLRLLDRLITKGPVAMDAEPIMVPTAGKLAVELAMVRRVRETLKRRKRRGYRNRGRNPCPPDPTLANCSESTNETQ